jgi:murein DD-endopeptidase MepM/ murein hydrolase activator NlpD
MNKMLLTICCCLPLKRLAVTSGYGFRIHPVTAKYRFHNGIDLRARHDTVFAIADGIVTIGYDDLLGIFIKISDGRLCCTYGHLSAILTSGPVTSGDAIAITGATGRVTGEHLHLSISYDGQPLDPLKFLYQFILKSNNHE